MNDKTKKWKITRRAWEQLNLKLDRIENQLLNVERLIPLKPKRYLKFDECIPPKSVCKEIISMMDGIRTYDGFLGKLAEYYGCEQLSFEVNESIDPKYLAIYNPILKKAYSRKPTVDRSTVLHEFFHHLRNLNVVIIDKEDEEKFANQYASIFEQRANS